MTWEQLGGGRTTVQTSVGPVAYRESGEGRPVLFLHGLLTDGHYWDRVTPSVRDARVIVPDMPFGSHRSAMHPAADLTPPGLAALVVELIDRLELERVTLVAGDFGGAVAQLVATTHGDRLDALVLHSCDAFDHFFPPTFWYLQAFGYLPPGVLWLAGQGQKLPGAHKQPLVFGRVQKRPVPAELARYWRQPFLTDRAVRRDVVKVLRGVDRRHTNAAAKRLPAFDRPVRLVWGDTGRVFPIADGRKLAAMIPTATLTVVPDSYAHVAIDAPDVMASEINDMLSARPGA
ncbi:alpha/beta fold hydrolase [Phytohabitans rumicis]|uniref:Alpha/beta hydrolase n=1 Tax=Phytohabitans rumicis TaxID=1076125 RepID=A0A6V8L9Y0_9ACTN|nr:alpha/beta hydrolase [Phytohabitans rumicis]GFJ91601.1 alpha/beta hydrolase [Phytohabitans rumicis]